MRKDNLANERLLDKVNKFAEGFADADMDIIISFETFKKDQVCTIVRADGLHVIGTIENLFKNVPLDVQDNIIANLIIENLDRHAKEDK